MVSSVITSNPYAGPRPFRAEDAYLFFGRQREVDNLCALVVACPILLVYGPSGSGKTSLMQAGVIPSLLKEGWEVMPVVRLGHMLPPLPGTEIDNMFVFNTLLSWNIRYGDHQDPPALARLTLSQYLGQHKPQADDMGERVPRVAIFDQLEELFATHQARWQERQAFFEQLGAVLREEQYLSVVLLIREDCLAQLDQYARYLPGKLRDRMRVEPLRREAALVAITKPAQWAGRHFNDSTALKLIDDLMRVQVMGEKGHVVEAIGEYLEPVQLQLVCHSLWESLSHEATTITDQDLMVLGNFDTILARFYESAIQQATAQSGVGEEMLRRWFEEALITPLGTRSIVFQGLTETGGLPNRAVDVLAASYLLHTEARGGARWLELTHDRLIGPIRESNRRFIAEATRAEKSRSFWQRWRKRLLRLSAEKGRKRQRVLC